MPNLFSSFSFYHSHFYLSNQALSEKLKEAEETQRSLQKDCETYKKVLAETVRQIFSNMRH